MKIAVAALDGYKKMVYNCLMSYEPSIDLAIVLEAQFAEVERRLQGEFSEDVLRGYAVPDYMRRMCNSMLDYFIGEDANFEIMEGLIDILKDLAERHGVDEDRFYALVMEE